MTVDRTLVAPGDTIKVTLASPTNTTFRGVMLAGTWGVGIIGFAERLPASFEVTIGLDAQLGKHGLNVMGTRDSGEPLMGSVEIAIERRELPEWIEANYGYLELMNQGAESRIPVRAKFSDGVHNVDESAALRWTSANPRIARVDKYGEVLGLNPGTTTLTATYTSGTQSRRATVQVKVPRPSFSVSPTPFDFGRQVVGSSSMARLTLTNTSGAALAIERVTAMAQEEELRSTDDCATGVPLAVGATCTISVVFTPQTVGETVRFIKVTAANEEPGFAVLATGIPAKPRPAGKNP
jgi:hypothetical protein